MNIGTILVPVDFSEDSRVALEVAVEFAKRFGARIELMHAHIVDTYAYSAPGFGGGAGLAFPQSFIDDIREASEQRLKHLAGEWASSGVPIEYRAVRGPAAGAIEEEAERLGADLIVMGTRGLSGLKHALMGSVAERVVRLANCPVLTVKGSMVAEDEG